MADNTTKTSNTSWENVNKWYDETVSEAGHYYHQTVILPNLTKIFNFKSGDSLLDLACGQGVLERDIPTFVKYTGLDASFSLINSAKGYAQRNCEHQFVMQDICKPFDLKQTFTHISVILALQNLSDIKQVFENARNHSRKGTKLILVINHPYFRIPRHTLWETDTKNNTIYRKINRYMSVFNFPIKTHPGMGKQSATTLSFHYPLYYISDQLHAHGFVITKVDEWISNKQSQGKHAKAENTARKEIPLFMCIECEGI